MSANSNAQLGRYRASVKLDLGIRISYGNCSLLRHEILAAERNQLLKYVLIVSLSEDVFHRH